MQTFQTTGIVQRWLWLTVWVASLLAGATSCLSKKKYNELQQDINDVQARLRAKNNEANRLKAENDGLKRFVDSLDQANRELYSERNRQRVLLDSLRSENRRCGSELVRLQKAYDDLDARYNDLMRTNLTQAQKSSNALRVKSNELLQKEKELAERERVIKELQAQIEKQNKEVDALMQRLVKELASLSEDVTIVKEQNSVRLSLAEKLLFASGKTDPSAKGINAVVQIGKIVANYPEFNILVEGHTDSDNISTDCFKDNWDLSAARAIAIARVLVADANLPPKRVVPAGRGEYLPVASNKGATGKARNRRIELLVVKSNPLLLDKIIVK
jgi:chemotaxis protein MotB